VVGDEGGGLLDGQWVAAEAGEPVECGVFAEPGKLAFGIVAMALLGGCDGLVACEFAAQEGGGLGVAERGERAAIRAVLSEELGGLFDEASALRGRIEHLGGAAVDASVELGARRIETEAEDAEAGERIVRLLGWRAASVTSMARMSLGASLA